MTFELMKTLQSEAYRILQNSYYLEKLSHAYLFEGFTGCGKDEMALYMAMQLLCNKPNKPCLECENCKKVLSGNHINVMIIKPATEIIKKEQIDELVTATDEIINNVIDDISSAKFDINPKYTTKNVACEFCKFKDICYMKEEDIVNLKNVSYKDFLGGDENA